LEGGERGKKAGEDRVTCERSSSRADLRKKGEYISKRGRKNKKKRGEGGGSEKEYWQYKKNLAPWVRRSKAPHKGMEKL